MLFHSEVMSILNLPIDNCYFMLCALWLYLVNDVGGIICRDYNGSLMAGCRSRVHFFREAYSCY